MHKKRIILFLSFLILLVTPLVYAANYGAGTYTTGAYGVGEVISPPPSEGGGGVTLECSQDSDCGEDEYCFENKCYEAECLDDSACKADEVCQNGRCIKLFDVEIIDFELLAKLGDFFDFTYLIKGVADINDDVEVMFWIEKDGKIITSGQDTIYLKSFEEKVKTTKLLLPSNLTSGDYVFFVQVRHDNYIARSHRTIEVKVSEGIAEIKSLPEIKELRTYIISILISLSIFILLLIFYSEIRRIKLEITKESWVSKHKISVLIFFMFIILGGLVYYLDWLRSIGIWVSKAILWSRTNILPYLSYILGIIFVLIILIIIIIIIKKKKPFERFKDWRKRKNIEVKTKLPITEEETPIKERGYKIPLLIILLTLGLIILFFGFILNFSRNLWNEIQEFISLFYLTSLNWINSNYIYILVIILVIVLSVILYLKRYYIKWYLGKTPRII